jgi:hypothetical protein
MTGPQIAVVNGEDLTGDQVDNKWSPNYQFGVTGVRRTGGYIDEEFLHQLRGKKGVGVFREMSDNDSTVGALLFAFYRLLSEVTWTIEPASSSAEDRKNAEFVEQCKDDMAHSWIDFVIEMCSFLPYGWSLHEMNFKRRLGQWYTNDRNGDWHRSKYDDGRIGWHSMPIRAQETLQRWVFSPTSGQVTAMVQMAAPDYAVRVIPMNKSLLFRTGLHKGNPEGRSILRNAYQPWFYKKRLQEFEAIGVERDLAGLPVAKVPAAVLNAKPNTKEMIMLQAFTKMVKGVRRDENEGLVFPLSYDAQGNEEYQFELLTSGGSRQFDTNGIIERYKLEILQQVLADFIQVGHEGTGSYSMHTDKRGLFQTAGNSFVKSMADTLNRKAVPLLFKLNGEQPKELPKFVPGDVDSPDLTQLGAFMTQMGGLGMQWFPDPKMEAFVRTTARVPEMDKRTETAREQEQRQALIISMANQRLQAIQIKQQAEQGEAQTTQAQAGADQATIGAASAGKELQKPGSTMPPQKAAPGAAKAPAKKAAAKKSNAPRAAKKAAK